MVEVLVVLTQAYIEARSKAWRALQSESSLYPNISWIPMAFDTDLLTWFLVWCMTMVVWPIAAIRWFYWWKQTAEGKHALAKMK